MSLAITEACAKAPFAPRVSSQELRTPSTLFINPDPDTQSGQKWLIPTKQQKALLFCKLRSTVSSQGGWE
jgi:hypothetical protein